MLLLNPHTLSFTFEVPEMDATEGVQKILGFSRGYHHWNSVRLGASAAVDNGDVRLFNYSYLRGARIEESIVVVKPKTELDVVIKWYEGSIDFAIYHEQNHLASETYLHKPFEPCKIGYLLNPYFETDAPENKVMPFKVNISDVRINGKLIKI